MERSFFWDKIAERYSKQPITDEAAYQKKLQITRTYFRPEMEILEFGCGTGSTAINHSSYVKHIQAIDISSKMLDIAQRKAALKKIKNIAFHRAAIDTFDASDHNFDAVLGLSILHLLKNKEEVIAKIYKMLKPGGYFITSTACIGDTMPYFRMIAPIGKLFGLNLKVFTTKELENSLTGEGFEIIHQWQPGKGKSVFIVAKKAAS